MGLESLRGGKFVRSCVAGIIGVGLGLLAASPACAEDEAPPGDYLAPPEHPPKRSFGVGVSGGAGFSQFKYQSGMAVLLPSLETQAFFDNGMSLDVTIPIVNNVIASMELDGFVFSADFFLNCNFKASRNVNIVFGPGLGFATAESGGTSIASLRIPGQIGIESLTDNHRLGIKLLARPWFEAAFADRGTYVGGGLLGVLVVSGFGTKP